MDAANNKNVLVSGASIAGLSTAYWLKQLGYRVTVVEQAGEPRIGGAAVNISGEALDIARRMGLLERLQRHALRVKRWEFKNADGITEGMIQLQDAAEQNPDDDFEVERFQLIDLLFDAVKGDVSIVFNNSITALDDVGDAVNVTFRDGSERALDLVFGCDGAHSAVRRIWFGHEAEYAHFLEYYFALTIVDKLLIEQGTAQFYNVPGKGIMLNAYNGKTDIAFCFHAPTEISYDYRDADQQRDIVREQFAGLGWRVPELLDETDDAKTVYFDKFCQIKMPSWSKGRVALVGDAAYCASPAAGIGASLAMIGPATLADALEKHAGDFVSAFREYDQNLRSFIDEVQATAVVVLNEHLMPRTEEAIRKRNAQTTPF